MPATYTLGYLRSHPLVGRILADPEGMLSVLALGGGSVLETVTEGLGRALGALVDDGVLRSVDGVLVGEIFVRLIASFLLLPRLALDPERTTKPSGVSSGNAWWTGSPPGAGPLRGRDA